MKIHSCHSAILILSIASSANSWKSEQVLKWRNSLLACSWAAQSESHYAYGIDLDTEPMDYDKIITKLTDDQKEE